MANVQGDRLSQYYPLFLLSCDLVAPCCDQLSDFSVFNFSRIGHFLIYPYADHVTELFRVRNWYPHVDTFDFEK